MCMWISRGFQIRVIERRVSDQKIEREVGQGVYPDNALMDPRHAERRVWGMSSGSFLV